MFYCFLEGTVTNPAISLVLYPVSIFLSLPAGHGNAFVNRRVHPNFLCHFFINIPRFACWAVFLSKQVGHYLKPINNLWILSFLSQITLVERKISVSEWICLSNSIITLVYKRPKNRLQLSFTKSTQKVETWGIWLLLNWTMELSFILYLNFLKQLVRSERASEVLISVLQQIYALDESFQVR